jgi:hypothetical protein
MPTKTANNQRRYRPVDLMVVGVDARVREV